MNHYSYYPQCFITYTGREMQCAYCLAKANAALLFYHVVSECPNRPVSAEVIVVVACSGEPEARWEQE
jgi:hypothetical protein